MNLEETIMHLTARTPSGGGFWLGDHYFLVRYDSDFWEWEYRGNIFYDLVDLSDEVQRRSGAGSPLARYHTVSRLDRYRELRA